MKKQTAGRDNLGEFAPKFAQVNDDILFGEIWSRTDKLSLRDRSIITICIFMGKGIVDESLKSHLINAKKNGITKEEMAEIITHASFYAGWPNAWAVFRLVKDIYEDDNIKEEHGGMFGMGSPNTDYAKYFKGNSYLKMLASQGGVSIANVTFEPSCRNNWHIHKSTKDGGQILVCVEGEGWYQEEGKESQSLHVGDIVTIPANVKHWHGAKKDSWFSHLAIEIPGIETENIWLEEVTDEEYYKLGEDNRE